MRRFLFWSLCFCLLFPVGLSSCDGSDSAAVIFGGTTGKLTWTLTEDGVLTITGEGPMPDYRDGGTSETPPWYPHVNRISSLTIGEGVTRIGDYAFMLCSFVTKVVIPESVTSMGDWAFTYYMQNLNKQIEENKSLRAENDALKTENNKVKQRISQLDEKAVERVTTQLVCAKEELASAKSYNTTLMEMYNDLKARWNAIWQEPEMTDAWRRVEARKEKEAKEKARKEAEAKRESMARQNRYIGVLDKFIHEGHEALSSFAKTDRVNFNETESASIYYGIMASAVKHNIGLDSKACIDSAAKSFLSGMSWNGFTDFKQECVTNWTKLFATNEVQFTDNAIDNFLAFVDHMSCSADTYVSLGGSNGCADQLTNWDGTQKLGLGIFYKEKKKSQSR